ncbi:MAG: hypothetical protein LQ350_000703 [Teloschistes chrysophthalmus]|nr:MAG: hypothetical protein LQ350_000703 [Niorma chrysophthalma]
MSTHRRHSTQVVQSRRSSESSRTSTEIMDYIHDRAARAVSEQLPKKSGNSANIMVAPAKKATLEAPQAPRGMGAKETQNFIDKLIKENWSLKLDITLQRKAEEKLRAKAEKAEELEKGIAGLEKTNKDLVEQMAKRDHALEEAFKLICSLETDEKSAGQAPSKTLLLKLAALSNTDSAAATSPATTGTVTINHIHTPKVSSYTDDWVFEVTPSPKKSAKPTITHLPPAEIINLNGSTLSLRTTNSFEASDDYSDRFIEEMSLCSEFDPDREYDLEAMVWRKQQPSVEKPLPPLPLSAFSVLAPPQPRLSKSSRLATWRERVSPAALLPKVRSRLRIGRPSRP